jgi:hypothetical protein
MNVFDTYGPSYTPEEEAEIARLVEVYKTMTREEAQETVAKLARQLMALSTRLSDERVEGRVPHESELSQAAAVKYHAEMIHRQVTMP